MKNKTYHTVKTGASSISLTKHTTLSKQFYSQWLTLADFVCYIKISLNIPKGKSEAVHRRTYNAMAERKRTQGKTRKNNDLQNWKLSNMIPTKNRDEVKCPRSVSSSCSNSGTRCAILHCMSFDVQLLIFPLVYSNLS
jgi:hypothetical protein